MTAWRETYKIAHRIDLTRVLDVLEHLAVQQGGEGLEFWKEDEEESDDSENEKT